MTFDQFQKHMSRLVEQFGKSVYSPSRVQLIWKSVKDFSDEWWETTVDQFIGYSRQPPLMAEIAEFTSRERERLWKAEKEEHSQDAKKFIESFGLEDIGSICQAIVAKVKNEISEESFTSVVGSMRSAASLTHRVVCAYCEDSGLVMTRDRKNYEFVYRCHCSAGVRKPASYPAHRP